VAGALAVLALLALLALLAALPLALEAAGATLPAEAHATSEASANDAMRAGVRAKGRMGGARASTRPARKAAPARLCASAACASCEHIVPPVRREGWYSGRAQIMSTDSLVSLRSQLLAIPAEELAPPHVCPRTASLVALGVVDFVRNEGKGRFAELAAVGGLELHAFDDLARLAEALLRATEQFEAAPHRPRPVIVPNELDVACRGKRASMQAALGTQTDPVIVRALRRQRLSYGPIDLAIDLRAGAALLARHAPALAELATEGRALAAQLETHLWAHDTEELREARHALNRVWCGFEPAYHGLAHLGRELFAEADGLFPTLEAIADLERQARHESSSQHPAAELMEAELPPSRRGAPSSRRAGPSSRRMRSAPPPPAAARALVEVILHAGSESNVWLGFSQDIAEGGVFVASYVSHPIGAELDLDLLLNDRDAPMRVSGEVCWLRPPSAGDDMPAGYGVRLTEASKQATRLLTRLANVRTPIFYDD
jgi:Tfp pilus assembly protein PilZ